MGEGIRFSKMEAGGNDFVVVDNRSGALDNLEANAIRYVCARRTGVGADGLLLLTYHAELDFLMEYYNADGGRAAMCGNGARCMALYAHELLGRDSFRFVAGDGEHTAWIARDYVRVTVRIAEEPREITASDRNGWLVDVGVPHFVTDAEAADSPEISAMAAELRYSQAFGQDGANVDLVEFGLNGALTLRTFERGVETETLSCGTGAVAAAWVAHKQRGYRLPITVRTTGGEVVVREGRSPVEAILEGPARTVYRGEFQAGWLSALGKMEGN